MCIRDRSKGTILKVELEGSRIVLRKSVDDAVSRARGRFRLEGFDDTDAAMRAVRGQPTGEVEIEVATDGDADR